MHSHFETRTHVRKLIHQHPVAVGLYLGDDSVKTLRSNAKCLSFRLCDTDSSKLKSRLRKRWQLRDYVYAITIIYVWCWYCICFESSIKIPPPVAAGGSELWWKLHHDGWELLTLCCRSRGGALLEPLPYIFGAYFFGAVLREMLLGIPSEMMDKCYGENRV